MRAISLWQPWASAIAIGAKTIETRSWYTVHRGPLAIHAAKLKNAELLEFYSSKACEALRDKYRTFYDLPFGAIVATCRLVECLRTSDIDCLTPLEKSLGDYSPGRYGWVLKDIVVLEVPIPFRGAQGFFEFEPCRTLVSYPDQRGLFEREP